MEAEQQAQRRRKWFPLESNPDVCNTYVQRLGFPSTQYSFTDVMAAEDWAVEMVPQPIMAYVLLFPITNNSEAAKEEQKARIETDGQVLSPNVVYMKQTIGNACGTIGLLHVLMNVRHSDILGTDLPYEQGSFIERFLERTRDMDPQTRGYTLENDEELSQAIEDAHESAAQEGQSNVPGRDDKITTHFLALVPKDGHIYELDGRKRFPINHGPYSSPENFGIEAVNVIKREFFEKDPEEVRFGILALTPNEAQVQQFNYGN